MTEMALWELAQASYYRSVTVSLGKDGKRKKEFWDYL